MIYRHGRLQYTKGRLVLYSCITISSLVISHCFKKTSVLKVMIVDILKEKKSNLFVADHLAHHRLHRMIPYLVKLEFLAFQQ